ncbi:MAG: cytochrome oxidase [Gallionellaceae bacterium]|jgi:cytochrome c oxidase cbb3-type subunit 1|nr:cytochrome oxidase [Gallionellaceae bacterium]
MSSASTHPRLVKFLLASVTSLFIGTMHGMLQVWPPIRAWLDAVGSPLSNPGHMIDPLAHAHMNLVGGLVMLAMGSTYYLLPIFTGKRIYSNRLINHSFGWTFLGVLFFYTAHMVFGIWEGSLLLAGKTQEMAAVHHFYGPIIAVAGTTMAIGFFSYFVNITLTMLKSEKNGV